MNASPQQRAASGGLADFRPPASRAMAANEDISSFDLIGSSDFRIFLHQHHERVGELARILARTIGLSSRDADRVARAGALHDIGKLFVPEAILQQPGPLNAEEQLAVRRHSFWGYVALRRSEDPDVQLASMVALQHHECFDGSGYPFGIHGTDICLEARIVTICDVYDALRAQRPYKEGFSHDRAMSVMLEGDERIRPAMFDPELLAAFVRVQDRCATLFEEMRPRC